MIKHKNSVDNSNLIRYEIVETESNDSKFKEFLEEKAKKIFDLIQNSLISLQKHKKMDIFSNSDLNVFFFNINETYRKSKQFIGNLSEKSFSSSKTQEDSLLELQKLFNQMSTVLSGFGTNELDDIFYTCFGKSFKLESSFREEFQDLFLSKLRLIKKYGSFINYKMTKSKSNKENEVFSCCDKIVETSINIEQSNQLECFEPNTLMRSTDYSIQGIRIVIQNKGDEKTLVISCILDDIDCEWIQHEHYIQFQKNEFNKILEGYNGIIDAKIYERLINSLTLKDYLIYSKNDIYKKYIAVMKDYEYVKSNNLNAVLKRFGEMDIINQRKFLIHLLICNKDDDNHYIAYILYDALTPFKLNNAASSVDSNAQNVIYSSFPWNIKLYFKDAMRLTMRYTNENKYDVNKISLDQQILLMKSNDTVKQKALIKLKEIKYKPEDQGSKAKQYLEGLLKIPFEVYRKEPVLTKIEGLNEMFNNLGKSLANKDYSVYDKNKYTLFEIKKHTRNIRERFIEKIKVDVDSKIKKMSLVSIKKALSFLQKKESLESKKEISEFITTHVNSSIQTSLLIKIVENFIPEQKKYAETFESIENKISSLEQDISSIKQALDDSIYAHSHAKTQILKIISQWINGEQNGYCFGFEGAPGIGKTSLAKKGLANCLKDENGIPRPFSFIALGGSSNGPTLEGHNYTYVNSTWGKIVDTLMDAKCMNPIIYIDELDKVSKTEQGKEIIGILMHLIDSTQNDEFQDKYFNGIPIDLSKVLFIFSYNDPDQIDPILLNRIHRIKFDNLTSKDKHVICKNYIIPEINKKMGFENTIVIQDETLDIIIDNYTVDLGIRKLKEILFDLYGEINIELLLKNDTSDKLEIPIVIKKEDLGLKYMKKYSKICEKKIHPISEIGIINGLWANTQGKGGIISIECSFFPTSTFMELKLTGMQGDVMKESMNVSKTLAWNLTSIDTQSKIIKTFEETCNRGIHVHCPEGAVSKDGPSAGAAITVLIYSLFNNRKIKHNYAITGEITLNGDVTAIGGLELKIIGGIRAGVKHFIYPESNKIDFEECNKKYAELFLEKNISFVSVKKIKEILEIIFET